jgi:aminopeptidase N
VFRGASSRGLGIEVIAFGTIIALGVGLLVFQGIEVAETPQRGLGDPAYPLAGNPGYQVTHYDIAVRYEPSSDRLDGHTTITATASQPLARFSVDLWLPADAVEVNGRAATIHQRGGKLFVTPVAPIPPGQVMTVQVDYGGRPSQVPLGSISGPNPWVPTVDGVVAVAREPDGAAWWYPCNDYPTDKASFEITATVPDQLQAISNGALVTGGEPAAPGWWRWRWRETAPMATYLATLAVGHYDIVRRDTPVGPYLAAYARGLDPVVAANARTWIEQTPDIVAWLSSYFGPYPFDQLGGVISNAPGFTDSLETQTRPMYANGDNDFSQINVVHELAHQWFGDSVSLRSWPDIWLNEGFATYAEWMYQEHTGGKTTAAAAAEAYTQHPPDDAFWKVPPGRPDAADELSHSIYDRGAMALQAIRATVGDEKFFASLRAWTTEHHWGNADTAQFITTVSRVAGQDINDVARTWLFTPTRPPTPPGTSTPMAHR